MKVQVLFFGATAEAVGEREIEISLGESVKAGDAFAEILEKYPPLKKHSLLFALNQEYSSGDEIIKNGDELAIFTAVSGG
jgi:molybdopterin synthase sulfur carrier subunit